MRLSTLCFIYRLPIFLRPRLARDLLLPLILTFLARECVGGQYSLNKSRSRAGEILSTLSAMASEQGEQYEQFI
jgi:hypothetical protein